MRNLFRLCLTLTAMMIGLATAAQAQGFGPAIKVNDQVVTQYELAQRIRMLQLFRTPGDVREIAADQLIDDRLRRQAARELGIAPSEEEIIGGMQEFAGRANLSADQFLTALQGGGVAPETFRDFVSAGLAWRSVVQAKFGPRVQVSEQEIDRAISSGGASGATVQVLMSEVFLPFTAANKDEVLAQAERIRRMSADGFARAARESSAAPSAAQGGRVNWVPASNLAPQVRGAILGLRPGQISAPIEVNGQIALFLLRAIEQSENRAPSNYSAIEYAAYYIPGGRSEQALAQAAKIKARVDTCDDLYGIAKGQPAEVLDRGTKMPSEIPADIAAELAKLDEGEVSTNLTRANGQTLVFLMMCGRSFDLSGAVSREGVAMDIQNRRLASFAEGYLQQLRSEARITRY
ncbi:peptidylprolyl isomerase [Pseudooceanicola onchidii]|uniref:peptidylprolyl isomerase n=1 Tax=Pseudooceanicola onchidii TaxID=2562279 RepID=UPI001F10E05F|nr:peptidylprolyl isomerase [Pseudooceanicola onchidii]